MKFIPALLWLIFFAACATEPLKANLESCDLGGKTQIVVPFELDQNHIFLKASIDDHGPYLFALDSAASHLVDLSSSEPMNFEKGKERIAHAYGGREVHLIESHDHSIQIGGLQLTHQLVYLADIAEVKKAYDKPALIGMIGRGLFQSCVVSIDYHLKQLALVRPSHFHYQGNGQIIPLSFPIPNPVMIADVDSIRAPFEVDTGNSWSITFFRPWAEANDVLSKYSFKKDVITGHGLGGPLNTWVTQGQVVRLGTWEIGTPWIRVPSTNADMNGPRGLAGSIGNGILKHFRVIFDYSRKQIILEKNESVSIDDQFVVPRGLRD